MAAIHGISHSRAVRALKKAGFRIIREGKHTVMYNGCRFVTIPRGNPINSFTMAGIVKDAGLTAEKFRELL
jgi:predicted RNA binding protein YcfA (HicA-like mRNA interferase family)